MKLGLMHFLGIAALAFFITTGIAGCQRDYEEGVGAPEDTGQEQGMTEGMEQEREMGQQETMPGATGEEQQMGQEQEMGQERQPVRGETQGAADFSQFDENNDGSLSQDEFDAIFESWDQNGDGTLDRNEWRF